MSINAKKELLFRMRRQYDQVDKKGKTEIIDALIAATGYHRKYLIAILGKPEESIKPAKRSPRKEYDADVQGALVSIWTAANQICSKRLAPFLPEFIETLERFAHLRLSSEVKGKLLKLSPATIDRLLKQERKKHQRGKTTTRPGNLLKQRIKIRTFAEWNESGPGFFECDLVAHCGERVDGAFLNTLVLTDISTCWTEFAPLLRKSDVDVTAAIDAIRAVMPIHILGVDTDNGSEFINEELFSYCGRENITFTRSRPYRKNDQAHVEQKNGSVIRRAVGYERFEGVESWTCLLNLYRALRLYVNFFQPSCKLLEKTRIGSRVKKKYDAARTPYQRLLESGHLKKERKTKLIEHFESLDPVLLLEQIGILQDKLLASASGRQNEKNIVLQLATEQTPHKPLTASLETVTSIPRMKRGERYRSSKNHINIQGIPDNNEKRSKRDDWNIIRLLHDKGVSDRAIADQLGKSRSTVAKYLRSADAPCYSMRKPRQKPMVDRWREKVEELFESEDDHRYAASMIYSRLVTEQGYTGSQRTIRSLVAEIRMKRGQTTCRNIDSAREIHECRELLASSNPLAP